MSWDFARESAWQFMLTLWHVLPWLAAMGAVFSILSLCVSSKQLGQLKA